MSLGTSLTQAFASFASSVVVDLYNPSGQPDFSQLEMPRDDPGLLVISCSVTSQLQDLGSQVLHDCRHVHWGTSSNSLRIVALPEQSVDPSDWELKSCPTRAGLSLSLYFAALPC